MLAASGNCSDSIDKISIKLQIRQKLWGQTNLKAKKLFLLQRFYCSSFKAFFLNNHYLVISYFTWSYLISRLTLTNLDLESEFKVGFKRSMPTARLACFGRVYNSVEVICKFPSRVNQRSPIGDKLTVNGRLCPIELSFRGRSYAQFVPELVAVSDCSNWEVTSPRDGGHLFLWEYSFWRRRLRAHIIDLNSKLVAESRERLLRQEARPAIPFLKACFRCCYSVRRQGVKPRNRGGPKERMVHLFSHSE